MIGIGGCIALTAGFTFVVKQKKAAEVFEVGNQRYPKEAQIFETYQNGIDWARR